MAAHRRLKHGKQNLKCGLCEFETVYAKQLWDHKKRFHDGDEKMFDCNQCDYSSHLRNKINSQSLEDTQVGYILQEYTLDNYTLKNTLWLQKAFSSKTTVAQKCQGAMEIHEYHFAKTHLR